MKGQHHFETFDNGFKPRNHIDQHYIYRHHTGSYQDERVNQGAGDFISYLDAFFNRGGNI